MRLNVVRWFDVLGAEADGNCAGITRSLVSRQESVNIHVIGYLQVNSGSRETAAAGPGTSSASLAKIVHGADFAGSVFRRFGW